MFQKKNNIRVELLFLTLVLYVVLPSELLATDPNVSIEMERATHEKVRVAVTQFALGKNSSDPEGLGLEARKVLETDLRLSELFVKITPAVYEQLELSERGRKKVDLWAWHQMGVQWLIKTEYSVIGGGKLSFVFRLYDTVSERFVLGKRYTVGKNLLRKVIHRYADELVLQLTGKRGVAETHIAFLSNDTKNKEIFTIDFDGFNSKQMTHDRTLNLTPTWSPNGK